MRTIDPELWSKRIKVQRPKYNQYGQQSVYKYEIILRKSLVDAGREYWDNCSVPAVKYINKEETTKSQRCFYILFSLCTLMLGIVVVTKDYLAFTMTPPLVISGQSSEELISDISFPAVAVCSNSIISKSALNNYTDYLYNHPKNQKKLNPYSKNHIRANLNNFGALLMMALPPVLDNFEEFLQQVDPAFNITDIMFRLSPARACGSMLRRCSWQGRLFDCKHLFAARTTALGFCCVFNSRYYPEDTSNQPYVLNMTGQNLGLGFVLTENPEDFAFVRRNVYGAEILIFEGSEYPLLESGDVHLYPVPLNSSLFASVRILTQLADHHLNFYNEDRRGCRTEGPGRSECFALCRRNTSAALCDCVPYTLHAAVIRDHKTVCSLRHLSCLNKHREKFMYLYPKSSEAVESLSEEVQDALHCDECTVRCNRRQYTARLSYSKYTYKGNFYRNFLTEGLSLVNSSTVRVYFNRWRHERYVLEVNTHWYELFVKLSAEWLLITGISVVCNIEVIYYCTFRWLYHFIRRTKLAKLRLY